MFVRFIADWAQYQGGEVRDFDKQYADQLIADGKAVYAGSRDQNFLSYDPVSGALVDAGGNLVLSVPVVTTWANRAAVVSAGGNTAFFTDVGVGGSYWDYIGGRWRPQARRVMLGNLTNEVSTQSTSSGVLAAFALPAGLWQDGDILSWSTSYTKTGGTAETASTDWRISTTDTSVGLSLGLVASGPATTQQQQHTMHRVRRLSATTARNCSANGATGLGTSTAGPLTRTIPDQDAAISYWVAVGNLSVGAETLTLTAATLYLESGV